MQKFRFLTIVQFYYGLAYKCPFYRRKNNCPFNEIEHLSFKEKVDWIDLLSEDKQRSIWNLHLACFKNRENCRKSMLKNMID
jgi:hypothetical protein